MPIRVSPASRSTRPARSATTRSTMSDTVRQVTRSNTAKVEGPVRRHPRALGTLIQSAPRILAVAASSSTSQRSCGRREIVDPSPAAFARSTSSSQTSATLADE